MFWPKVLGEGPEFWELHYEAQPDIDHVVISRGNSEKAGGLMMD